MIRQEHRDSKYAFNFVSYVPEHFVKGLPLIIQLHGAGERGDDLSLMDVHGFSHLLKERDYPCITVMPQCPSDTFWAAHVESLVSFIEQITTDLDADRKKVYLTGLSMGGFGTWYTAMARPDLFTAIAPVCGGGMPWNAGVLTMPVWAFHGALDTTVSPVNSDEMIEKLRLTNKNVKYTRSESYGHNVWQIAYTSELMEWFLSRSK